MNNDEALHANYNHIVPLIENGAKVLDLGCGDGTLLKKLIDEKMYTVKGLKLTKKTSLRLCIKGFRLFRVILMKG